MGLSQRVPESLLPPARLVSRGQGVKWFRFKERNLHLQSKPFGIEAARVFLQGRHDQTSSGSGTGIVPDGISCPSMGNAPMRGEPDRRAEIFGKESSPKKTDPKSEFVSACGALCAFPRGHCTGA